MTDDDDPLVWATRARRKNALRVLGVGAALLLVGAIWLAKSLDFQATEHFATDNTGTEEIVVTHKFDPRLVSGVIAIVGSLLTIAGVVMLARARVRE